MVSIDTQRRAQVSIILTRRCHANDISVLEYLKVLHVFYVLQSFSTRLKLFLEQRDSAAIVCTHVHKPAPIQTPAVFHAQIPHITDLKK